MFISFGYEEVNGEFRVLRGLEKSLKTVYYLEKILEFGIAFNFITIELKLTLIFSLAP